LLKVATEVEAEAYIQQYTQLRDENGHALIVRNGRAQKRTLQGGAGSLMRKDCLRLLSLPVFKVGRPMVIGLSLNYGMGLRTAGTPIASASMAAAHTKVHANQSDFWRTR